MFDSVFDVMLTDASFVFLSALKHIEKWYSLIYQFGYKFSLFNKVLRA